MAASETTIVRRETVIVETTITERVIYRGARPPAGPPALLMIFFALVLMYFAIFTLMFCGPGYTLLGIVLLLMSFSMLVGTYLALT